MIFRAKIYNMDRDCYIYMAVYELSNTKLLLSKNRDDYYFQGAGLFNSCNI